jgi:hypothetical protein
MISLCSLWPLWLFIHMKTAVWLLRCGLNANEVFRLAKRHDAYALRATHLLERLFIHNSDQIRAGTERIPYRIQLGEMNTIPIGVPNELAHVIMMKLAVCIKDHAPRRIRVSVDDRS